MKKKSTIRLLTFLAVLMLVSMIPFTVFATDTVGKNAVVDKGTAIAGTDYHVTSVKHYSIAPDISERVIITNNATGNSQTVANVMEINTSGGRARIVAGYGNRNPKQEGWALKTTTEQAHVYEQESGLNVVGGVNASWFNVNTGEPSGYLVMNGVVHHDSSARAFLAAFDDGSVNVFREGTTLAQAEADQSAKKGKTVKIIEAVDALVAMVWNGEVVISQSGNGGYYPRTCVGIKADGTVVLFQADGTMAPRSVGYTAEEEAHMMVALGCVAAIQLDEGGSSTYISQREGESDLTMRNTPAGGSERVISGSILVVSTVAASGEFDHAAITPNAEYYTPNSIIELTARAMDYSGASANALPEDATFTLDDETMGSLSVTTVNGKKATAVFTSSGKTGNVTVNMISGGKIVGSAVIHIQNPDNLSFASAELGLNYKQVSDLGLKATYQNETVNLKDGDVVWSITDETAGTFAGNLFTVTDNVKYSGSPVVTVACGDLTASVTLNIGMAPVMIIDGGDADPWDYSTIGTTVESFAGTASNAVAMYHYAGRGGVVKGSVVSDTDAEFADIVRFGHKALKLEYDWTNLSGTDGACLGLGDNLAIDGTPTALGIWVYIPEGVPVPWLRAQIATSTNGGKDWTNAYINFSSGSAANGEGLKSGWQYLQADMTQYAGAMIRVNSGMLFRAMVTTSGIGWSTTDGIKLDKSELKGYILIDNLCVVYGANNQDTTAPVVKSIQLVNEDGTKTELEDGMTLNSADLRFFVTYDDNEKTDLFATGIESAYFYFDGVYRGKYEMDILGSTSALMHFSEGMHSITFYLKDGYGNVTRETRYFNIKADNAILPGIKLNIPSVPTVGKTWEAVLTGNELASITSLSASISVTRGYPATAVFPEGVTGTYSYDPKGIITIEIATIDHSVFKADRLATVSFEIPTSAVEGNNINIRITKGSYGCKQTEGIDIGEVNQYAAGFTTLVATYPVEAMYRISADNVVAGSTATAKVTVIADETPAAGVDVYVDDTLIGTTDEEGNIDLSSLVATKGRINLRVVDSDGNCSYQIVIYVYDAVGDETGAPYNISSILSTVPDGKTITWMSNPLYSADTAIVEISENADMSGAKQVAGVSKLISYSSSNQINRISAVTLTGLKTDKTYYYRVGDGSIWSGVESFTVKSNVKETKFFLLADIQEEAALEGMRRIAEKLAGQYNFGIQLGDAVDNVRYFNQWNDAIGLFAVDGIRNTDILHVIGNHEADDDGNDSMAAKSIFGVPAAWYSVERGDVYIAVLNHTSDKDTLQQFTKWLVDDAAKTSCRWKVLVTHVPAYYTNPTGGGETYFEYLPAACDAAGIDFYFSGNDHSYARTKAMKNGLIDENGTVYYICGSTGGKSYAIVDNPAFNFDITSIDFDSVYLSVTANKNEIVVTAYNVDVNGNVTILDTYSKGVHYCDNDEHTYIYDRATGALKCSACSYETTATAEMYSGWATDAETGRVVYFTSGKITFDFVRIGDNTFYFDDNGLGAEGIYTFGGTTCVFSKGAFIRSTDESVITAGWAGKSAFFVLHNDGKIAFSGEGAMFNFGSYSQVPWRVYRTQIKTIVFGKDITTISRHAFNAIGATTIQFEENSKLKSIGYCAFEYTGFSVIELPNSVNTLQSISFGYLSKKLKLILPESVKDISVDAFSHSEVVLIVKEGSYAHNWAIEHNVDFTLEYMKKNGPVGDYFYIDDVMQRAYQLAEYNGDIYFVYDGHKLAKNCRLYLAQQFVEGKTFADGTPITVGYYDFDADGKMIVNN